MNYGNTKTTINYQRLIVNYLSDSLRILISIDGEIRS